VLEFVNPVRAAAKGRSVVIYTDNYVVAGGFIENAIK
jgi:tRNA U34 2-thiouridine synthase MnmA/TrmU